MFEEISRGYQNNSIIVTSNRLLSGWDEVFPNTTCVASIVGRLHLADVISIDGESYALNEGPS